MKDKVQQTIVMRAKFPDGEGGMKKLRSGKYIAQGSHSSIAFLSNKFRSGNLTLSEEEKEWIEGSFTKVCLCVDTEEELMDVYNRAKEAGLTVYLIEDAGHTEFHGVPTKTCLAIGPHYKSVLDKVTKDLRLF